MDERANRRVDDKERLLKGETVLVTGGGGFVGSYISRYLENRGAMVYTPTTRDMDIRKREAVESVVRATNARFIVHTAAWTDVNGADDPAKTAQVLELNVEGTLNVALVAEEYGRHLIHLSSDFVFEGTPKRPGPYKESDRPANTRNLDNIGNYGISKIRAENTLSYVQNAIVRLANPFGDAGNPKDFINKLLKYNVAYDDQYITPTYLPDLANAIGTIVRIGGIGVFHVATTGVTTPYEIRKFIASEYGDDLSKIKPASLYEVMKQARASHTRFTPRPLLGGLDTESTQRKLGIEFHTWQNAVREALKIPG